LNWITSIYTNHPYIATLGTYYVLSAFIGALPAPTSTSTPLYQFVFKFANTLGGNILRAISTRVEGSPNFQDAVNVINSQAPVEKPVVIVDPNAQKQ
jgi:hypothetical protein